MTTEILSFVPCSVETPGNDSSLRNLHGKYLPSGILSAFATLKYKWFLKRLSGMGKSGPMNCSISFSMKKLRIVDLGKLI